MQVQSRKSDGILSEINIVPFVDIILVVLIVFLLVSPALVQPAVDIELPQLETATQKKNIQVLLSIDVRGLLYFNRESMSSEDISVKLHEVFKKDNNARVVIAADKNVAHGNVLSLIDTVRKVGIKKFAVSVDELVE